MMPPRLFILSLQLILLAGIAHQTTIIDDESLGQCDKTSCTTDTEGVTEKESNVHENENKLKYSNLKGHLKPFGESGSQSLIPTIKGFPPTHLFFLDYLLPSLPLLMKRAATQSPTFHHLRNDDYLYRLSSTGENRGAIIDVEHGKKEDRKGNGDAMPFYKFLEIYNKSDIYMVSDSIPMFNPFIFMPCPLQCQKLTEVNMKSLLWFSSGGTKSVVHTDGYENVNCLYRGNKTLIMMDPSKLSVGSIINNPFGFYSKLDVEKVDLNKYPTLRGAHFIMAHMEPGDCLYIPQKWIHQVISYGSNLAINVWFDQKQTVDLLRKGYCLSPVQECDPTFTFGRLKYNDLMDSADMASDGVFIMRQYFEASAYHGKAVVSPEKLPFKKGEEKVKMLEYLSKLQKDKYAISPFPDIYYERVNDELQEKHMKQFIDIIKTLDANDDGILTSHEFDEHIENIWTEVMKMVEKTMKNDGIKK